MPILFGLIFSIFYIGIIVVSIMAYWKTFTKAGQPGWACLIPIYNYLIMADIAGVSRSKIWKALVVGFIGYALVIYLTIVNAGDSEMVFIAPVIMIPTLIIVYYFLFPVFKGISVNFGQSVAFAWGLIFLNIIFFAILGFGSAQYKGNSQYLDDNILDANL